MAYWIIKFEGNQFNLDWQHNTRALATSLHPLSSKVFPVPASYSCTTCAILVFVSSLNISICLLSALVSFMHVHRPHRFLCLDLFFSCMHIDHHIDHFEWITCTPRVIMFKLITCTLRVIMFIPFCLDICFADQMRLTISHVVPRLLGVAQGLDGWNSY